MDPVWYYLDGTTQCGPLTSQQLVQALKSRADAATVNVWRDGMQDWKSFSEMEHEITPPATTSTDQTEPDLKGIGGWLILVAIGVAVAPIYLAVGTAMTFVQVLPAFPNLALGLKVFIAGEILANVGMFIASLILATKFFRCKKDAPRWFIGYMFAAAFVQVSDALIASGIFNASASASDVRDLVRAIVSVTIWVPYMLKSRRVANTFVE